MSRFLKKYWYLVALAFVLLLGGFLRFYRISEISNFSYDQARDTDKIREMIQERKIILLGPSTSVSQGGFGYGTTYFGPIYYYLLIPSLWLAKFDPVGPIAFTALLGTLSIFLIYFIMIKLTKDKSASVLSSFLYAISPAAIEYSRFIWNPNFIPFFALLLFLGLLKFKQKKSKFWCFIVGLFSGVLIQFHFYTYFLVLFALIFLLLNSKKKFLETLFFYGFGFILGIFPMIIFDIRHNFLNSRSIFFNLFRLSSHSNKSFGFKVANLIALIKRIIDDFVGTNMFALRLILITLMGGAIVLFLLNKKFRKQYRMIILLFVWGCLASSIFNRQGIVEKRYLLPLSPFIFIFLGIIISQLNKRRITAIFSLILGAMLIISILPNTIKKTFTSHPVSLGYCRDTAFLIIKDVQEGNFDYKINIANLADLDRRATSFRYFFNAQKIPILGVEDYPNADILYVIDKDYNWDGIVNNTDTWEVYSFEPKVLLDTIDGPEGVKIYKIGKKKKNG